MKSHALHLMIICLMVALNGSAAIAVDTVQSVVAELQKQLPADAPVLAECEIVCKYGNETWKLHARSLKQPQRAEIGYGIRADDADALSVLFPSQTFLAIGSSLEPFSLLHELPISSVRLLPAAKLDGVDCSVLELDRLPSQGHLGVYYEMPAIRAASVRIYVHAGRIIRMVARVQRNLALGGADTPLIAEADVRYRGPKIETKRAPALPSVARIQVPDNDGVPVFDFAWSPDSKQIACLTSDAGLDKFDLFTVANAKETANYPFTKPVLQPSFQLGFGPDGKSLVTHDLQTGKVLSLDVATGKELKSVDIGPGIRALFSPDATRTLVWDAQSRQSVYDSATGHRIVDLAPIGSPDIQFSSDGKLLALLLGNQILIKDAVTGLTLRIIRTQCVQETGIRPFPAWQLAFSKNSRLLAIGDGRRGRSVYNLMDSVLPPACLYIYEVETGRLVQTLTGTNGAITALDFAPNSSALAAGYADDRGDVPGENTAVLLWETKNWTLVGATAVQRQAAIAKVRFAPDGKSLATLAEGANTVDIWSVPQR